MAENVTDTLYPKKPLLALSGSGGSYTGGSSTITCLNQDQLTILVDYTNGAETDVTIAIEVEHIGLLDINGEIVTNTFFQKTFKENYTTFLVKPDVYKFDTTGKYEINHALTPTIKSIKLTVSLNGTADATTSFTCWAFIGNETVYREPLVSTANDNRSVDLL